MIYLSNAAERSVHVNAIISCLSITHSMSFVSFCSAVSLL